MFVFVDFDINFPQVLLLFLLPFFDHKLYILLRVTINRKEFTIADMSFVANSRFGWRAKAGAIHL